MKKTLIHRSLAVVILFAASPLALAASDKKELEEGVTSKPSEVSPQKSQQIIQPHHAKQQKAKSEKDKKEGEPLVSPHSNNS